ncbi:MAG: uracil-DNA glycosylase [Planctomycetaceae bacterium]|nr:uracil-DNA glycosylase [Planctomycetaceae bacterium]
MPESRSTPIQNVNLARLHKAVRQRLQSLKRAGLTHLNPPIDTNWDPSKLPNTLVQTEPPAAVATPDPPPSPANIPADSTIHETPTLESPEKPMPSKKQIQLNVVCQEVAECTACDELAATRNKTVFGVGNPNAKLVFYGEAPGADEDRQGEPFVGRAGKKLNEIIEAMGIQRQDIYILNTIKCRPPGNRNPSPEEQANCSGFLQRQLEIIKPDYIVCLGAIAARSFLKVTTPIGELRGEFHIQGKIKVLCTYHPAYILRNPSKKRDVWEDIKFLMKDMGLKIPKQYL